MQDSDGTPLVPLPGVRSCYLTDSVDTDMIRTQVEMVTIPVKLDPAARVGLFQLKIFGLLLNHFQDLYDKIEEASKQKFEALLNEEGGVTVMQYNSMIRRLYLIDMLQVPTNVLGMLTRLRQVALHTGLVPSNYLEELQNSITNDSNDVETLNTLTKKIESNYNFEAEIDKNIELKEILLEQKANKD